MKALSYIVHYYLYTVYYMHLFHNVVGGNIFVHKGNLYFSNFSDQRLYKQLTPDSTPTPVTAADTSYRYANGDMSAKVILINSGFLKQ